MSGVTQILQAIEQGEQSAERLLPLVYEELRKLAAARMANEAAGHTLQPTALVHEAWLRLAGIAGPPPTDWHWLLPSQVVQFNPFAPEAFDVAHGNGIFVGVGGFGSVVTSPDGLDWAPVLSGAGYAQLHMHIEKKKRRESL